MTEIKIGDKVRFTGWKPLGNEIDADFALTESPAIGELGVVVDFRFGSKWSYDVIFDGEKQEWMASNEIELVDG